ncbi:MAG: DsrE family protein [Verrucomicrobia bacterium]|jgi:hypothetical protein|nr:DsrE family protein [Verrucomicrobiota bacterium]
MAHSVLKTEFRKGESIGVLIKSTPGSPSFKRGWVLIRMALESGVQVYIYLLDEAVRGVWNTDISSVLKLGGKISVCAFALEQRGIDCHEEMIPSGLTMMSDVLLQSDRAFIFN